MSFFVDSTCAPSATEIEEAQLALQRDGEDLLHIESAIASLLAEVEVQLEKQRTLQSRILISKARISPMRFLPTKILQRIFKACLPDDTVTYVKPSLQSAPLLLCQICRRWREVAEATSELWSSIAISNVYFDQDSYPAMVTRWLAASHNRPLAVHLSHFKPRRYSVSAVFRPHSALIHDLSIHSECIHIKSFMDDVSPALKRLFLSVLSARPSVPPDLRLSHSSATTGVTHLMLLGQHSLLVILPTTFPQMTHLALCQVEEINLGKILIDFPGLVELKIGLVPRGDRTIRLLPPASPAPPIMHHALQILRIDLTRSVVWSGTMLHLASIFDSLSLPSLRELDFTLSPDDPQASVKVWLPDSVKALFGRSSCSAKQLLYLNFKPPSHMDVLFEQLKSVGIALRVDNGPLPPFLSWY